MQQTGKRVLRIDASARTEGSVSRALGDEVTSRLGATHGRLALETIDLAGGLAPIDADWIDANFTPPGQRSAAQQAHLAASDAAVAALQRADIVVLTTPMYNFSVPSVLKAWIDRICRAGLTFRYTAQGPEGLLADRPVYLVMATGGVVLGSEVDYASTYLRQVFRFIGIGDVRLIAAERVAADMPAAHAAALATLQQWLPDPAGQAA